VTTISPAAILSQLHRFSLLTILLCGLAAPLGAQVEDTRTAPLLGATDAYLALGATLGTLALAPLDARIAASLRDAAPAHPRAVRLAAKGAEVVGGPGTLAIAGGLYVTGNVLSSSLLSTTGVRTAEAVVLAEILVYGIKGLAGRARPRVEGAEPLDFGFGRGVTSGSYRSFPSGHTAAAFATAAVLTSAIGERHPDSRVLAGTLLYSGATLTGISRVYYNEHWLSDIGMGAAIGTYSGWKVVRYHRGRTEPAPLDRLLLSVTFVGGRPASFAITPLSAP
jgi:membrane-associated phospholipid phosphatase